MSYSKQNFRSGDTLYASQLNAMDDEIAVLEAEVESTKNMVGSPLTASTAAGMTDQTKIYVYTGNETGYTAGHWYYYNGTAWTDGGVYNSVAVNTDTSLTVSGQAADSKAVGDAIDEIDSEMSDVKETLNDINEILSVPTDLIAKYGTFTNLTNNGITFAWTGHSVTVSGTATATAVCNVFASVSALPEWLTAGKTYNVIVENEADTTNVGMNFVYYYSGGTRTATARETRDITIPSDATGIIIRMKVENGATVNGRFTAKMIESGNVNLGDRVDALEDDVDALGATVDDMVDDTLAISGKAADAKVVGDSLADLQEAIENSDLIQYNSYNLCANATPQNKTASNVTFTWNDDGSCAVVSDGAASEGVFCVIMGGSSTLPDGIETGNTYHFVYQSTDPNIAVQRIKNGTGTKTMYESTDLEVTDDTTGFILRVYVASGKTVNGVIKPILLNAMTNRQLEGAVNDLSAIGDGLDYEKNKLSHYLEEEVYSKNLLYLYGTTSDGVSNGVSYTWDGETCKVVGTASSASLNNIIVSTTEMPICFLPGKTYKVVYDSTDSNIKLKFLWYKNGSFSTTKTINSTQEFTVPATTTGMIARIAVDSGTTVNGTIRVVIKGEAVEEIDLKRSTVESGQFTCKRNKIKGYDYTDLASNTYFRTDYIPVLENRDICITGFQLVNKVLCAYFDENHNPIGCDRSKDSAQAIARHYGKTPYGCRYIKFHLASGQGATFNVFYTNYPESKSENEVFPYIFNRRLFSKILDTAPMIAVIDDDTSGMNYVTKFYDKCVENDIVGNYAVITKNLDNITNLSSTLLGYEAKGFGMLYHCDEQVEAYRDTSSANRDMVVAELNFVTGLRKMRTYGFCNYDYWIIPYGTLDDEMREMAQRHGMKCCFGAANSSYVTATEHTDRWSIPRCGLVDTDESVASVKALMDECYAKHGMFYLMTHFNSGWDVTGNMDRFDEAVQYAKSLGFRFVTVPIAMKYWMPVYQLNEMF